MNIFENGLRVGLIGEAISTVEEANTAIAMGSGALQVYATPAMIALMESAAVASIESYLPANYSSVGIEINISHISATPIGEGVVAMAEVVEINEKRIDLQVRAWDERELIGIGTHTRYIIEIDEFLERLEHPDVR